MVGMSFMPFLVLTIIAAVVAGVYQYVFHYRFLEGFDSAFGKLVIGWIGAWLGSPVLGHWFWKFENIYIVPAVLGSIALVHLNVLGFRAAAKLMELRATPASVEAPKAKVASAA